jgi:hypothetical protein
MDLLVCAFQNWLTECDEHAAGAVAGREDSRIVNVTFSLISCRISDA